MCFCLHALLIYIPGKGFKTWCIRWLSLTLYLAGSRPHRSNETRNRLWHCITFKIDNCACLVMTSRSDNLWVFLFSETVIFMMTQVYFLISFKFFIFVFHKMCLQVLTDANNQVIFTIYHWHCRQFIFSSFKDVFVVLLILVSMTV